MTHYRLIVNPVSGRGAGKAAIPGIREMLNSHRLDYDLVETARPWHAAELARGAVADGCGVVVSVGGDGTANEVLNGLMQAKQAAAPGSFRTSMGILSVGRGNDFAFGVNVPASLEQACTALAVGPRRAIDVGRVSGGDFPQGRFFGIGVGIGFDAVVGFEAAKMKRLHGFPNYIVAALKTIFLFYQAPTVRIQTEDDKFEISALMVSVMNGRRMGGGFMMAPQGLPSDGLLDLCIAEQVSRMRIFQLIPHFMRGTQATQNTIRTLRTRKLVVTALQGSLPAHADGETICTAGKELTIELLPQQIEMICQGGGDMG
jgi:diacylglycerol kinase (ATP)